MLALHETLFDGEIQEIEQPVIVAADVQESAGFRVQAKLRPGEHFEEFFEVLTWAQLGLHPKPCGLLNVSGYYDRLFDFLDLTVEERFVKSQHRELVITSNSPTDLLDQLVAYRPPQVEKWIDRESS